MLHARATIASNPDDAASLAVAGFVLSLLAYDKEAARGAFDRALYLNASSATTLYLGAQAHALAGRPEQARMLAERALRLSPFDSLAFQAHMALCESALQEGRYSDAIASFGRAGQTNTNFSTAYHFQAIALALAGRANEAAPLIERAFALEPSFRTRVFEELGVAAPLAEKLREGAQLLGLPT